MADSDSPTNFSKSPPGAGNASSLSPGAQPTEQLQKVELDLDDAPFLTPKEPEPQAQAPVIPQEKTTELQVSPLGKSKFRNPVLLGALAAAAVLVVVLVVALAVRGGKKQPPEPEIHILEPMYEVPTQTIPTEPEKGRLERFLLNLEPFLILVQGQEDSRLLTVKFSVYANDLASNYAMQEYQLLLRNTVYDYLTSLSVEELLGVNAAATLKDPLRDVIASALPEHNVGEVLIEQILMK